ncbi:MAG TPA: hypothetical protein VGA10_02680, partial [Thermoanaerobaculia bacterium]
IWINTHFNHPNEITPESAAACDRLLRAGIPVNNQAVLLRGVNDCPYTMRDLVQGLMKIRVRPYYLYLCDQVMGAEHFQCRGNLRFASASADSFREIENAIDALRRQKVEHLDAPAEANGIVSAGAQRGLEGFDRFERIEFLVTVAGRAFRLEVVS